MPNHSWPLRCVFVVSVLHGFCVAAQQTNCAKALGDVEVRGNLDIAAPCQLTGTDVRGNVTLFSGGSLIARDVDIRGNLDASRADFVAIEGSRIDGNLKLDELVGDNSSIENTEIRGNVSLTKNRSAFEILNNEVGGNVKASGNTGGLSISGNSIDGHLDCSGNTPAPIGLGNRIEKPQGQCQNLLPQESSPSPSPPPPSPRPETPFPQLPPSLPPTFTPPLSPPPSASPPATGPPGSDNPLSRDTIRPTLMLRGPPSVNLTINSPYADEGATATDSHDGDLTSRIVVVNPLNTALLGTYTITYSVSDLSGNAASPVTRTVTVGPNSAVGGGGGGAVGWSFALLLLPLVGRYVNRRRNV
jgi:Domain of unknown function (DUF5011)